MIIINTTIIIFFKEARALYRQPNECGKPNAINLPFKISFTTSGKEKKWFAIAFAKIYLKTFLYPVELWVTHWPDNT